MIGELEGLTSRSFDGALAALFHARRRAVVIGFGDLLPVLLRLAGRRGGLLATENHSRKNEGHGDDDQLRPSLHSALVASHMPQKLASTHPPA